MFDAEMNIAAEEICTFRKRIEEFNVLRRKTEWDFLGRREKDAENHKSLFY